MKSQSIDMENYFTTLEKEVKKTYELAKKARNKGYDPEKEVEIPLAKNMAERVEGLISISAPEIINKGIPERIQELEKQYGKLDWRVALSVALEVAQEKFCKFETKIKAIETAIRIGFAYVTVGVVSSPLEGFVKLELKKRIDNQKEYFCLYYSGPVRSAGGTGASVSLLIADYLRKQFNYDKFDPTEKEIKRIVTELYDYHERITNLQYLPSPEEIEFMVSHLPLQVDGDPSEKVEVSNYKDLPRTETNRLRNGVCLVYGECIIQKAPKVFKQLSKWGKDFDLDDWNFMEDFVNLQKKMKSKGVKKENKEEKIKSDYTFIKDIVAGRPVITYPKCSGGLRLRYGRSRNTGLSATGMHPASLYILNNFIAIGTQLKTERPGKGTTINSVDTLEGPIVKLKSGEVLILNDSEQAKRVAKEVEEILYLGDILISYGDFFNRAHSLVPMGFCEEYWVQLLEEKESNPEKIAQITGLDLKIIINLFKNPLELKPTVHQALILSKSFNIPFHPLYTYHWTDIKHEDLSILLKWLEEKTIKEDKLILPFKIGSEERIKSKRVLEILGIPHKIVANEYIVIPEEHTIGLRVALGMYDKEGSLVSIDQNKLVLDIINELAEVPIKDKSGTYIGARMGRPEKAKVRKLTGSPHGLFPVGEEGGRLRCFQSALEATKVTAEFPINYCELCKKESIYQKCHLCDNPTIPQYWCKECKKQQKEKECKLHGIIPNYKYQELPIKEYYEVEQKRLKLASLPELIKGIRGTSNKHHIPEHLVKAVLRSIHNIYVNKDGTIRYDMTELPITHFKPKEIGTAVEKLKELGYSKDIYEQPLTSEDQIVEIKPQDIILPACTEGDEEGSDIILFKTAKFVDDLLVHLYQEKPFYNLNSKEELIGHLVVSLAPHTSAGIVSRIIGFSKTQGFYAHPMLHCAVRRDCDGDEVAIILLLDCLLNFSRKFLPDHRGSTQDAPLVLTSVITPTEVDDMVFDMDVSWKYPLEFYRAAETYKMPWEVKIEILKDNLGTEKQFEQFGFTHHTTDINKGVRWSAYKSIPTMGEKVLGQMNLAEKIRAVDTADVARLVIERHFIRDIKGNLRKFSMQQFRCVNCNKKFRRPPLLGKCTKCKGKLIFTISEGSVTKYLRPSIDLAKKYNLPTYLRQTLEITQNRVDSVFGKDKEKQDNLQSWFA